MGPHSDWRLAARFTGGDNFVVVAEGPEWVPVYTVYDITDPDQLPVFFDFFPKDILNFPYGNSVEAD